MREIAGRSTDTHLSQGDVAERLADGHDAELAHDGEGGAGGAQGRQLPRQVDAQHLDVQRLARNHHKVAQHVQGKRHLQFGSEYH